MLPSWQNPSQITNQLSNYLCPDKMLPWSFWYWKKTSFKLLSIVNMRSNVPVIMQFTEEAPSFESSMSRWRLAKLQQAATARPSRHKAPCVGLAIVPITKSGDTAAGWNAHPSEMFYIPLSPSQITSYRAGCEACGSTSLPLCAQQMSTP